MAALRLRLLRASDVEHVGALLEGGFTGWSASTVERELNNPAARYVVLEENRNVTGFAGLWLIVGEGHVVNVIVEQASRGRGLSRLLVHALTLIAASLDVQVLTLEVRASNDVARSLYRSYGFYEVGQRPNYYADGEDAVIMTTENIGSRSYADRLHRRRAALEVRFPLVVSRFDQEWSDILEREPGDSD